MIYRRPPIEVRELILIGYAIKNCKYLKDRAAFVDSELVDIADHIESYLLEAVEGLKRLNIK